MTSNRMSFYETITAAIKDMTEHGYDKQSRVDHWIDLITKAATRDMVPKHVLERHLKSHLTTIYTRLIEKGVILKQHPGVAKYTLNKVKPKLRAELDRRIAASAQLIVLNREAAIQKTIQRFSGWSTSIPIGGSDAVNKVETKASIKKSLSQLPYEERRILIDQGHKLVSSLSEILAADSNAIAGIWHSNWKQSNYDYRPDHKDRDLKVYVVRNNWAISKKLMKPSSNGYTDEITAPGEEVYCRCYYQWVYNVSDLPSEMLTKMGQEKLNNVRKQIKE